MDERTAEIISEAKGIITTIEVWSQPLSRVAVRARRLAQTLDDDAAVTWLSLECSGMTHPFRRERRWKDGADGMKGMKKASRLRAVPDLAKLTPSEIAERVNAGKLLDKSSVMGASISELERIIQTELSKEDLAEMRRRAGQDAVTMTIVFQTETRAVLNRIATAIHEWATGVYIVHKFHALAGNIFDQLKTSTDALLTEVCPSAISKLTHAIEQANTDTPEAWSSAAMSCRRVLKDFADAVYPAREEKVDGHDVTDDKFINRLYTFAKERGGDALASEELDGLGTTLSRMQSLASKGIHTSITREEAHAVILRTYMLLSRFAQLAKQVK